MFQINGALLIFFAVYQDCCLSAIGLATFGGEKIANQLAMTAGHIWLLPEIVASVVGSKAANGGQVKTGQRMWPGTWFFYPIFS
jgi:hypothetical protein